MMRDRCARTLALVPVALTVLARVRCAVATLRCMIVCGGAVPVAASLVGSIRVRTDLTRRAPEGVVQSRAPGHQQAPASPSAARASAAAGSPASAGPTTTRAPTAARVRCAVPRRDRTARWGRDHAGRPGEDASPTDAPDERSTRRGHYGRGWLLNEAGSRED